MNLIEILNDVIKIIKKSDNVELNEKILELQSKVYALLEENQQLKNQVKNLEESINTNNNLVHRGNAYYIIENGIEKGPYCVTCWDKDKKLVNLIRKTASVQECGVCKNKVRICE